MEPLYYCAKAKDPVYITGQATSGFIQCHCTVGAVTSHTVKPNAQSREPVRTEQDPVRTHIQKCTAHVQRLSTGTNVTLAGTVVWLEGKQASGIGWEESWPDKTGTTKRMVWPAQQPQEVTKYFCPY